MISYEMILSLFVFLFFLQLVISAFLIPAVLMRIYMVFFPCHIFRKHARPLFVYLKRYLVAGILIIDRNF